MTKKLKDYQVLDVFCGGTFYKVRHKVTNNIFAWKAYDCSDYLEEQIQNVVNEVKRISKVQSESLLRYYDTILHAPSKTLYFILEYNAWQSVQDLVEVCKVTEKYIAESFIWYLILELARVCKSTEHLNLVVLQKCLSPTQIFVNQTGEVRINCFDFPSTKGGKIGDVMLQVGQIIHTLCYESMIREGKIKEFCYSDDLRDVINFLIDKRNTNLRPDVVLYHPTVLANLETSPRYTPLCDIIIPTKNLHSVSEVNKCDSEKVVDLCRKMEPAPRAQFTVPDSPIYSNVSPKRMLRREAKESACDSLSPTLAALALELPGFVPCRRRPVMQALEPYNCAQRVTEETFNQHWMSRLMALRQREESLNKRERDLIAKEIANSPMTKIIKVNDFQEIGRDCSNSNGITLPPVMSTEQERNWVSRRSQRKSSSVHRSKPRRKSYAYEDLDSSLSADEGDSIVVTAKKFTKGNMPQNIFPGNNRKEKVHFTSTNPFTESDESVTLTFYELGNVDSEGYQVPKKKDDILKDINKFKYLDAQKVTPKKRHTVQQWGISSPIKQAKMSDSIFNDITNTNLGNLNKSSSKTSITTKACNELRHPTEVRTHMGQGKISEVRLSARTRSSVRQSLAFTPTAPSDVKKKGRKSLLPFKTPFKFMTSTKI